MCILVVDCTLSTQPFVLVLLLTLLNPCTAGRCPSAALGNVKHVFIPVWVRRRGLPSPAQGREVEESEVKTWAVTAAYDNVDGHADRLNHMDAPASIAEDAGTRKKSRRRGALWEATTMAGRGGVHAAWKMPMHLHQPQETKGQRTLHDQQQMRQEGNRDLRHRRTELGGNIFAPRQIFLLSISVSRGTSSACPSRESKKYEFVCPSLHGKSWHIPLQGPLFKFSCHHPSRIRASNTPAILCFLAFAAD